MIDIKQLKANPKPYEDSLKRRGLKLDLAAITKLDDQRALLLAEVEQLRAKRNKCAKPTEKELAELRADRERLNALQTELADVESKLNQAVSAVPNLIAGDVPDGKDESDNQVLRQVGKKPRFDFDPKPHWQLGEEKGLIEFTRAADVAGSRFAYLKGGLVRMQFALVQLVLSVLTDEATLAKIAKDAKVKVAPRPFIPVVPPVMVKSQVLERMARIEPREDRYYLKDDDLFLAGSAEHTLGPLLMDEIVPAAELPIRFVGYATSFRREAGSWGKDVKGILRMHQFDKLEMESFCLPEDAIAEQDFFVAIQEYLMQQLGLPYQVVLLCAGDMGDPDYRQIDIETWLPGQDKYRETHSADLMGDYQSRRLKARLRRENGEVELVHMNDATAFAIGRTLIAIMENYQTADGSIRVPEVLQPYVGGEII